MSGEKRQERKRKKKRRRRRKKERQRQTDKQIEKEERRWFYVTNVIFQKAILPAFHTSSKRFGWS